MYKITPQGVSDAIGNIHRSIINSISKVDKIKTGEVTFSEIKALSEEVSKDLNYAMLIMRIVEDILGQTYETTDAQ